MRVHHSELYHMRGSGIGGIFSTIFRTLVPIAKSLFGIGKKVAKSPVGQQVLRAAKRNAVKAGLDLAQDTLAGDNVAKSIKKRAKQAGTRMLEDIEAGRGAKRGRKNPKGTKKKTTPPKRGKKATPKKKPTPKRGQAGKTQSMGVLLKKLGL